jgi:hypothetical protein
MIIATIGKLIVCHKTQKVPLNAFKAKKPN